VADVDELKIPHATRRVADSAPGRRSTRLAARIEPSECTSPSHALRAPVDGKRASLGMADTEQPALQDGDSAGQAAGLGEAGQVADGLC
jgi:hypothetical protein